MFTVLHLHSHQRTLGSEGVHALHLSHSKLTLFQIDVDVCSRGNRERNGGIGGVGENEELERDVLLELHTYGVGLFED